MSTDPKLIEAVARAYAKIADGANYDAMPPESREMYAKRVMPIITAYEAARGDGVEAERERCAQIVECFAEAALKCERCGDIRHTYAPGGCSGEAAFRASDEFRRMTLTDSVYDAIRYFEKHLCNPREITLEEIPGILAAAIRKGTT